MLLLFGPIYTLPATIPIHWNVRGEVDGYGSSFQLLLFPIIVLVINGFLFFLQHVNVKFNYPVKITPQNEDAQKQNVLLLLASLRCSIGLLFISIVVTTIYNTYNPSTNIGLLVVVELLLVFIPVMYFLYRAFKLR